MTKSVLMGIDVGINGAIIFMTTNGEVLSTHDIPTFKVTGAKRKLSEIDEQELKELLLSHDVSQAFVEKAQTMPNQNVSSMGRYMTTYGIIRGMLAALNIPYTLIRPMSWKRVMMKDADKGKGGSIVRVRQLFPTVKLNRSKDHHIADAILIAEYGRRSLSDSTSVRQRIRGK